MSTPRAITDMGALSIVVSRDTTAPSVPTGLAGTPVSQSQINLSWNSSTDTGGSQLKGYIIYRGGTFLSGPQPSTTFQDRDLAPGTQYAYRVSAVDNAGNESGQSTQVLVTTQGANLPPVVQTIPTIRFVLGTASNRDVSVFGTDPEGQPLAARKNAVALPAGVIYNETLKRFEYNGGGSVGGTDGHSIIFDDNPADASYQSRSNLSGVFLAKGFDTDADFVPVTSFAPNAGILPPSGTTDYTRCTRDTAIKASGVSSMRFRVPSNTGSDSSGEYFTNFSPNYTVLFGAGSEFWIQWRQRFSPEFLNTQFLNAPGWKQIIIGTGDPSASGPHFTSCSTIELVMNQFSTEAPYLFPIIYNGCPGSSPNSAAGLFEAFPVNDFKLQNARISPYCLYSRGFTVPKSYLPAQGGNCFGYVPNNWMHFQIGVNVGQRQSTGSGDVFANSRIRFRAGLDGQPAEPLLDIIFNLNAGSAATNERYGKVHLTPYNSAKVSSHAHAEAYTWYDELLGRTSQIPDP
jgi:Fibronectin type III domain